MVRIPAGFESMTWLCDGVAQPALDPANGGLVVALGGKGCVLPDGLATVLEGLAPFLKGGKCMKGGVRLEGREGGSPAFLGTPSKVASGALYLYKHSSNGGPESKARNGGLVAALSAIAPRGQGWIAEDESATGSKDGLYVTILSGEHMADCAAALVGRITGARPMPGMGRQRGANPAVAPGDVVAPQALTSEAPKVVKAKGKGKGKGKGATA